MNVQLMCVIQYVYVHIIAYIVTDIHLEHRIFFQNDMLCNFGPHLEHLSIGWCSKCMSLSIGGCSKCMSVATKGKF